VLSDIKSAVDSLEPGLYDFLDALPVTREGYIAGLRKIQDVLRHESESSQGDHPPKAPEPAIEVRDREEAPSAQRERVIDDPRRDPDGLIVLEIVEPDGRIRNAPISNRRHNTEVLERLQQSAIELAP